MELKIDKLENSDGKVIDQANEYLVNMYDDLVKRADIKSPKRKMILTVEMSEDEDGEICTDAKVELKLPGHYPKLTYRFKGEIRKDKEKGLQLIFPGMEQKAS